MKQSRKRGRIFQDGSYEINGLVNETINRRSSVERGRIFQGVDYYEVYENDTFVRNSAALRREQDRPTSTQHPHIREPCPTHSSGHPRRSGLPQQKILARAAHTKWWGDPSAKPAPRTTATAACFSSKRRIPRLSCAIGGSTRTPPLASSLQTASERIATRPSRRRSTACINPVSNTVSIGKLVEEPDEDRRPREFFFQFPPTMWCVGFVVFSRRDKLLCFCCLSAHRGAEVFQFPP